MAKRIIDFESTCEGCGKPVKMSREVDIPDTLTREQIQGLLKDLPQSPTTEQLDGLLQKHLATLKPKEHKPADHETYDAMLDCPECREWAKNTGKRWVIRDGEEPKEPEFEFGSFIRKESK